MWSVADAKAQLSEILRKARAGSPQMIGTRHPCMVVSLETYENAIGNAEHDGRWLIDLTRRLGFEMPLPSRNEDRAEPIFGE